MKSKFQALIVQFILLVNISYSQNYLEKFYQIGKKELHGLQINNSEENGFYILTESRGETSIDYWTKDLWKLDSLGNILWKSGVDGQEGVTGHMNSEFAFSQDSSLYVIRHFIGCLSEGSIMKLDRFGNIIYTSDTIGTVYPNSKIKTISRTSNTDILYGGYISQGSFCNVVAPYLVRMRSDGIKIWEERFDSLFPAKSIIGIKTFNDSTYIVNLNDSSSFLVNDSGQIIPSNFPHGRFEIWPSGGYISCEVNTISKLDSNLSIIWQSNPLNNYSFTNFEINSAGNIYVTGEKDTCNGEMIVCSFDSTGVLLFSKIYGGDLNDEGESIICLDTNYVIAIGTHSIHEWAIYEAANYDCTLFRTYTAQLRLVKLPTHLLTSNAIQSSTGNYYLCSNDSIVLTGPNGFNYSWNTGETSQQITVDSTQKILLTISDQFGTTEVMPEFDIYKYQNVSTPHFNDVVYTQCSGNFNICLGVDFNDSVYDRDYKWYFDTGSWDRPRFGNEVFGILASTYYCVVSNVCGSDTSGRYLLENVPPSVSLGNDTVVCNQDSILITPIANNFLHFDWSDGSNQITLLAGDSSANSIDTISVTVTDDAGCTASDTMIVRFDNCVNVSNMEQVQKSEVYPNPFSMHLFIENLEQFSIVSLYDLSGRLIYSQSSNNWKLDLDLTSLMGGVYYLKIESKKNSLYEKVIKVD